MNEEQKQLLEYYLRNELTIQEEGLGCFIETVTVNDDEVSVMIADRSLAGTVYRTVKCTSTKIGHKTILEFLIYKIERRKKK